VVANQGVKRKCILLLFKELQGWLAALRLLMLLKSSEFTKMGF